MSETLRQIYYQYFTTYRDTIAQNIDLNGKTDTLGALLRGQVIDVNCRSDVVMATSGDAKGRMVVDCLLHYNDVEKYEEFINIWKQYRPAEADGLRNKIHRALTNMGFEVPHRQHVAHDTG